MKKRTRIPDIALRVILSIALVVSFVPIVPSSSFAVEPDSATAVSVDDSPSNPENTVGENDPYVSQPSSSADQAAQGGAASEGNSAGEGNSSTAFGSAGDESLGSVGASGSDSAAASSDEANGLSDGSSSIDYVREYAKLMADGNLYECDESGTLKQPLEGATPVEPYYVANLIVDSEVTTIRYRQFVSCHNLKSVRFEGKTLDSIDDTAFYDCRNLASVDLSGMSIRYLGELAFGTCVSLTGLTLNEPVTIQTMGYGCFSCCGLTTTSLDKIQGLTSLPDDVFKQCYDLVETGLDKNTTIQSIGTNAFAYCYGLADTGLGANTSVTTIDEYDGSEFEIMLTGPTHFSVSNADEGKYYSGISESASLVEDDAVWNENAMMGGEPFSMVIVKLKDAKDGDKVKEEMLGGVNMRKWVCRNAEYLITVNNGNYVLMVMCSKATCEKIADAFDNVLEEKSGTRLEKEFEMGF